MQKNKQTSEENMAMITESKYIIGDGASTPTAPGAKAPIMIDSNIADITN